jgi:hypothetical protein
VNENRPNQALELTDDRQENFLMTVLTFKSVAKLAIVTGSAALSR